LLPRNHPIKAEPGKLIAFVELDSAIHTGFKLRASSARCPPARKRVPQPTAWQRIGNQIEAAFISARADFVNLHAHANSMVDKIDPR
jgi:hypothetical protein